MKPRGSAATCPFWCTSWGACCRRTNPSFLRLRRPVSIKATNTSQPGPCEAMNASFRLENVAVCCGCTTCCLYGVYRTKCLCKGMCHVHFYIWNLPYPNVTVYISHVTAPVAATNPQYLAAMILSNVGGPPQHQNRNALFGGPLSHHWKAWSEYPQCENHLSCDQVIPPIYSTRLTWDPLYWSV